MLYPGTEVTGVVTEKQAGGFNGRETFYGLAVGGCLDRFSEAQNDKGAVAAPLRLSLDSGIV
jgi:hypothetical protein